MSTVQTCDALVSTTCYGQHDMNFCHVFVPAWLCFLFNSCIPCLSSSPAQSTLTQAGLLFSLHFVGRSNVAATLVHPALPMLSAGCGHCRDADSGSSTPSSMLPSAAASPRRWSSFGQQPGPALDEPMLVVGGHMRRPSEAASLASQALYHSSGTCSPDPGHYLSRLTRRPHIALYCDFVHRVFPGCSCIPSPSPAYYSFQLSLD